MAKFKLFLDAGHGGHDSGAVGHGLKEKDIVLDVCQRVDNYLSKQYPDIECLLSRNDDTFVELRDRTSKANRLKSDCLVSVHVNSASAASANGFESFIYTTDDEITKSYALQQKLHKKLADLWTSKGRRDRGKKKANFHMVREFKGAAVLVELGFIVNDKDAALLKSDAFLQQNAEEIADAVAEYAGVKKLVKQSDAIYRVIVDGKQTGAYAVTENAVNAFEKAVQSGASKIEAELVK